MPYLTVSLESRPPIAVLALNRPDEGNRIDGRMLAELREILDDLAAGAAVRVAILTGRGGVFSLGWDESLLGEARDMPENGAGALRDRILGSTFQFVTESALPVVAAINGDAFSAGFELALACDLRVAAAEARLGFPETGDGLIPMGGGTQRLARLAGRAVALEMILTGEPVDAPTALQAGLLSAVAAPSGLLDSARTLATAIANRGPLAVRLAKEAIHRGMDMPLDQALRFETDLTVLLQTTADRAEGVRAFQEKRPPRFRGR